MSKVFKCLVITLVLTLGLFVKNQGPARAGWWTRDDGRPVFDRDERPVFDRGSQEQPEPTNPPSGGPPEETQDQGDGGDDPCEPGESFTGPYCGWSPGQDDPGDDGENGGIGGTEVLGLSDTSSGYLDPSDIIQLTGFLCLLLYAKSKLSVIRAD